MTPHAVIARHHATPYARALISLFRSLEQQLELSQSADHPLLIAYLAGGMAVHLYTGTRVTCDVDAEFSARLHLPPGLAVPIPDTPNASALLYLDTNYNPMFSLLHDNYQTDAIASGIAFACMDLRVLSPLDLAVSKLARFAINDQDDIRALALAGLVTADAIHHRAHEALHTYIGNTRLIEYNIRDAVALARDAAKKPPATHRSAPRQG
jgi:hypothetical protein